MQSWKIVIGTDLIIFIWGRVSAIRSSAIASPQEKLSVKKGKDMSKGHSTVLILMPFELEIYIMRCEPTFSINVENDQNVVIHDGNQNQIVELPNVKQEYFSVYMFNSVILIQKCH